MILNLLSPKQSGFVLASNKHAWAQAEEIPHRLLCLLTSAPHVFFLTLRYIITAIQWWLFEVCRASFPLCLQMAIKAVHSSRHPECRSWRSYNLYHHFSGSCSLWQTSNSFWKPPWGHPHVCQSCCSPEMLLCAVKLLLLGNGMGKTTGLELSSASSHQGSALRHSFFQREDVKRTVSAVETSLFLPNKVHHILTQPQAY